jgi:hypothetical protein
VLIALYIKHVKNCDVTVTIQPFEPVTQFSVPYLNNRLQKSDILCLQKEHAETREVVSRRWKNLEDRINKVSKQ